MTRTTGIWLITATLMLGGAWAHAQGPAGTDYESDDQEYQEPVFLINGRIIDVAIDRVTRDMVRQYQFDDYQLEETRRLFKQRFSSWIMDHRPQIVELANEYVEAILGDEPPTPEAVATWADRVQPLVHEFNDVVAGTTDEMRTYLDDEQLLVLEGNLAVYNVVTRQMSNRLQVWREGGYDWKTEWPRGPEFKEHQSRKEAELEIEATRAQMEAMGRGGELVSYETAAAGAGTESGPGLGQEAESQPQPEPTAQGQQKKGEWEQYVEQFIQRYQLDEDQQGQAWRVFRKWSEQRDTYLRRKAGAIDRLYKRFEAAKRDDDRARLREAYEKLNAPIARYFDKLKDDLESIPTRRQRANAAAADRAARRSGQAGPTGPAVNKRVEQGAGAQKKESPSSPYPDPPGQAARSNER